MFGKKKLAIGLVAVVALTSLVGAGVASAHGGGGGTEASDSIKDRVAEILGVEREELDAAFETAREETARGAIVARLEAAVEAETITQEEMEDILDWYDSNPDALAEIGHSGHLLGLLPHALRSEGIGARLNAMVEAGVLTQDQADVIEVWIADAPEALESLAPGRLHDGGRGFHGRGHPGSRGFDGRGFHEPWDFGAPEPEDSGASESEATAIGTTV